MKKILLATLAATIFGPLSANADFMAGDEIEFTGAVTLEDNNLATTDLSMADELVFGTVTVAAGAGNFTGFGGLAAVFSGLIFNPLNASTPLTQWSVVSGADTFWFDLVTLSSAIYNDYGSFEMLSLNGSGALNSDAAGFTATDARWSLQIINTTEGAIFSFSSDTVVPEPATLALFGLGLAGFGFASRRKAVKA